MWGQIVNFTQCQIIYNQTKFDDPARYDRLSWHGPVYTLRGQPHQSANDFLSVGGCKELCGTGFNPYSWGRISATLTTWILPIIAVLAQAPFESNKNWQTLWTLFRWIGSPIVSMATVLWNIRVTGRCAYRIVRATKKMNPTEDVFQCARDSFYLLSVINQYTLNPGCRFSKSDPSRGGRIEAEPLLRLALFGDVQNIVPGKEKTISQSRRKTIKLIRNSRRKGIVQTFVSLVWYLVALAISIQQAIDRSLGENATAHDLALGLLMGWLPVFVLGSIIDRNPVLTETIQRRCNRLVRNTNNTLPADRRFRLVDGQGKIVDDPDFDMFVAFAGQGRRRWHYGAALSVLKGLKKSGIGKNDGGWLDQLHSSNEISGDGISRKFLLNNEDAALCHLCEAEDLFLIDYSELWSIGWSTTCVALCVAGAFVLSYFTPTVGFGCRSGGYAIFLGIAIFNMLFEFFVWVCIPRAYWTLPNLFLHFCEMFNVAWLLFIIFGQTFGLTETCTCITSEWDRGIGGYLNLLTRENAPGVGWYWIRGTIIGIIPLGLGIIYMMYEWLQQAHLSTVEIDKAQTGLVLTRISRNLIVAPFKLLCCILPGRGHKLFGSSQNSSQDNSSQLPLNSNGATSEDTSAPKSIPPVVKVTRTDTLGGPSAAPSSRIARPARHRGSTASSSQRLSPRFRSGSVAQESPDSTELSDLSDESERGPTKSKRLRPRGFSVG